MNKVIDSRYRLFYNSSMPKRRHTQPKTWYEKGSLADVTVQLASSSWKVIKPLSESQLLSEKLLGYNALAFTFVSGIAITHFLLGKESIFSLAGLLFLLLSIFIGFVISSPYIKLMLLLINSAKGKIGTLRIANIILLAGLPLGAAGLLFNVIQLTQIALGAIAIQIIFVLSSIPFSFSTVNTIDSQVDKNDIKEIAGKIQFLIAIVEFVLTILLFVSAVIKGQLF